VVSFILFLAFCGWQEVQVSLAGYVTSSNVAVRFLAYRPAERDMYVDFSVDNVRIDDQSQDVVAAVGPGIDPLHSAGLSGALLRLRALAVTRFIARPLPPWGRW